MTVMTLPQLDKYLKNMQSPGSRGWSPVHNKLGKYYRNKAKDRMKKHVDVNGVPWAAGYSKPFPKIGDDVPMILSKGDGVKRPKSVNNGGSALRQPIKTAKGKKAARRYRLKYGPPSKPDRKPLVLATARGQGEAEKRGYIGRKRQIWKFLSTPGRSTRTSKTSFSYGYTPGTQWIEKLQNGGTYKGKRVPARTILGITKEDERFTESAYADYYEKMRLRGRTG